MPAEFTPELKESLLSFCRFGMIRSGTEIKSNFPLLSQKDWEGITRKAISQGLGPFIYKAISSSKGAIQIPESSEKELEEIYLDNKYINARKFLELDRIVAQFDQEAIWVILLKGIYLAQEVYPGPWTRTMGDLDLLVKISDLERADEILSKLGYEKKIQIDDPEEKGIHARYSHIKTGLLIELHWHIVPRNSPFFFDIGEFWKKALSFKKGAGAPLRLSTEDLLLHLCWHTYDHQFQTGLRALVDIGQVIERQRTNLDWRSFAEQAIRLHLTKAVYMGLRLSQNLLNVDIPKDTLSSLRPTGFKEDYLHWAKDQIWKPQVSINPKAAFLLGKSPIARKAVFFSKNAFPPRRAIASKFGLPPNSWKVYPEYVSRIVRLGRQQGGLWIRSLSKNNRDKTAINPAVFGDFWAWLNKP
jgi:hypothetical protein